MFDFLARFDFVAYDQHSGLHSIVWEIIGLLDDILYGEGHLPIQKVHTYLKHAFFLTQTCTMNFTYCYRDLQTTVFLTVVTVSRRTLNATILHTQQK